MSALPPGVVYDADNSQLNITGDGVNAIVWVNSSTDPTELMRLGAGRIDIRRNGGKVYLTNDETGVDVVYAQTGVGLVATVGEGQQFIVQDPAGATYLRVDPDGGIHADLPTADPATVGQLWNDAGTLKVSAG